MKNTLMLAVAVLFATTLVAREETLQNVPINDVQLYTNNLAKVSKKQVVELDKGKNVFTLTALPKTYQDNSLNIKLLSTKEGVTLVNYTIQDVPAATQDLASVTASLEQKLQELTLEKEKLVATRNAWIGSMTDFSKKDSVNLTGLNELIERVNAQVDTLNAKLVNNQLEQEKVTKQLEFERRKIAAPVKSYRKQVVVRVDSEEACQAQIALDYCVTGVSWVPTYKIDLVKDQTQINVNGFAELKQSTGEDWADVAVTLNTVDLLQGASAPELHPYWLSILTPVPQLSARNFEVGAMPMSKMTMADASGFAHENNIRSVGLSPQLTNTKFSIPGTVSVMDSRAESTKIPLYELNTKAKTTWKAVLRQTDNVYVESEFSNTLKLPILPGKVQLYLEGDFIGDSDIGRIATNEKATFGFGVDDQVKVSAEAVKAFKETVGITQSTIRVTKEHAYSIINNKSRAISLVVQDQIPVAQDEQIKVKLETWTLGSAFTADKQGIGTVTQILGPGKEVKGQLKYSVEYPDDARINL